MFLRELAGWRADRKGFGADISQEAERRLSWVKAIGRESSGWAWEVGEVELTYGK